MTEAEPGQFDHDPPDLQSAPAVRVDLLDEHREFGVRKAMISTSAAAYERDTLEHLQISEVGQCWEYANGRAGPSRTVVNALTAHWRQVVQGARTLMRYYVYVSDAKLELLLGQIPTKLLSRLAGEFKIGLKLVSLTVKATPREATRYHRLTVVEHFIDRNEDVSGLDELSIWFRGTVGLRSMIFGDNPTGLLLFTGARNDTVIALIGSAHHLVGSRTAPDSIDIGYSGSQLPSLFTLLRRDRAEWNDRQQIQEANPPLTRRAVQNDETALEEVLECTEQVSGPQEVCEFLARRLLVGFTRGPDGRPVRVVVGTPLYVALSDGQPR